LNFGSSNSLYNLNNDLLVISSRWVPDFFIAIKFNLVSKLANRYVGSLGSLISEDLELFRSLEFVDEEFTDTFEELGCGASIIGVLNLASLQYSNMVIFNTASYNLVISTLS
jgi:hypothetical protein